MEKYLKDNNGQAASSINGAISGLFIFFYVEELICVVVLNVFLNL